MHEKLNTEERKSIWLALSDLYLDTALQESDITYIAFKIKESPYTLEEVKAINKYEVFPVLQANLFNPVGEWAHFDETWLFESITKHISKKNLLKKVSINIYYKLFNWMCKDYLLKLEQVYNNINSNTSPPYYYIFFLLNYLKKL